MIFVKKFWPIFAALGILAGGFSGQVLAKNKVIDIVKNASGMTRIFFNFSPDVEELQPIVSQDLISSGSFELAIDRQTLSSAPGGTLIEAKALAMGSDFYTIEISLIDAASAHRRTTQIRLPIKQKRLSAHMISNTVYQFVTGYPGHFDTQIFATLITGTAIKPKRRIALMDYDGENIRFLTEASLGALLPRGSNTAPLVAFCAMGDVGNINIIQDVHTGKRDVLPRQGVDFAPRFKPSGRDLIFCSSKSGQTSIYNYNLSNKISKPLIYYPRSITVSPSYAPNESQFVFASDRHSRSPQLYITTEGQADEAVRISQGGGSYFAPVWSPDGKWIAFVRKYKGKYYLGIMDPRGKNERMLAVNHVIDTPSWAPNSRLLVFSSQQKRFGPFSLYTVDLTGRSLKKIPTIHQGISYGANHPHWSVFKYNS